MGEVSLRLIGPPFGTAAGPGGALGSRKARRLLLLLAAERGRTVGVPRIVEVLWGDTPPRRPAENVATLVSRLRAALGADVVLGDRTGYRLGDVETDLGTAARLVATARIGLPAAPGPAAVAAERAIALLEAGEVLPGEPDSDWVAAVRAEAAALLRTARHTAAAAALATGDSDAAIAAAEAAVRADRLDEPACRLLMSAHLAAGAPGAALAAYTRLREVLATELGTDPDPRTQAVHLAVLRGQPVSEPAAPAAGPRRSGVVGRAAELAALDRAWSDAATGRPSLILVCGEAGIGKTRLLEELTERVTTDGGLVAGARCYTAERSLFLQPVVDALGPPLAALPPADLRDLAGPYATDLAELMPVLQDVLGPATGGRDGSVDDLRRTFEAVTHAVRGLSRRRPLLLTLDDLQHAGLTTVELVHYLARRADRCRALVVVAVRSEEGAAALDMLGPRGRRIELGPLTAAAVGELAAAAGHARLAGQILQRTGGHPLFVVETLRGLRSGDTAVPATLQSAVLARVRRAGPEIEDLLRAGAVLGAAVDPAVVAAVLGLPEHTALKRCEQAVQARLLVVSGRSYEFVNDLVQEVLYATTAEPVRVAHHRRAADLLTNSPEAVAAHAAAVGDRPRAARALLTAGERALLRYALPDADALLGSALDQARLADSAELVARAHLLRGRAREAAGRFADAAADHRAALATVRGIGDERTQMHALRALGGHPLLAGGAAMSECVAHLAEGLAIAVRLGDRAVEAGLRGWLAVLATNDLRFGDALEQGRRAVRAARAAASDDALAAALDGLKNAHAYVGDMTELRAVLAELVPLLRRTRNFELLQWAVFESAFPAIAAADWSAALACVDEALEINRRSRNPVTASWFVAHLGWIARLRGRLDEAEEHGRRAARLAEQTAHPWYIADADALLGATLAERGETAEAVRVLRAARERASRHGASAYLLRCLGPLAALTPQDHAVLADADALVARIGEHAWFVGLDAYCGVARGWLAAGDPDRARTVLAPLLAAARRRDWRPVVAHAGLVAAEAALVCGADPAGLLAECARLGAIHGMPGVVARAEDLAAA
ncbi:Transcriptional regulatory protein, C terminal [Pseudonocardia thermophila]|uniref:Transcriptional regulatory protein, C terminal n=1 Tax=Pseudonocardia thermophila TaxID=1848 RepID=A0A1M6U195_PSETH|nr:AAA family ATPase [Pseudonocardia thermophila]SHK62858.1 Transcriptional regulatory protein, C terminal [Pseudonocardia thermophila]